MQFVIAPLIYCTIWKVVEGGTLLFQPFIILNLCPALTFWNSLFKNFEDFNIKVLKIKLLFV
jgi:hypothetical protein